MGQAKVLAVAWDGADGATVDAMLRDGLLPNLARVRDHGTSGKLTAMPGLGDDASWSSIATMVGPGVHGRFHHTQPRPHSYRLGRFDRRQMTLPPFWELIARARRKVAVLDIPKAPLGQDRQLRELANWMPHGEDPGGPIGSTRQLLKGYSEDADFRCHRTIGAEEVESFRDAVLRRLEIRQALALEWLAEESWDLLIVAFAESHCIGHHCWHVHDAYHPLHNAAQRAALGDPVEDVYRAQDRALGELIDLAGHDATVLVFSPLGMGPNISGDRFVNSVLRRLGARRSASSEADDLDECEPQGHRSRTLLSSIRDRLTGSGDRGSKYYSVPHDSLSSAIRLNVSGREPAGVIQRGADYDAHCEWLTQEFLSLVDPSTGRRLVDEVVRVAECHPGPFVDRFADLLIVWNKDAPINAVASNAIGCLKAPPANERTGNHQDGGWFVLDASSRSNETIQHPRAIQDLGACIAGLVGVSLSQELSAPPSGGSTRTSTR